MKHRLDRGTCTKYPPTPMKMAAPPKFFTSAACNTTKTSEIEEKIGAFSYQISAAQTKSKSFLPNGFSGVDDSRDDLVASSNDDGRIFFIKRCV